MALGTRFTAAALLLLPLLAGCQQAASSNAAGRLPEASPPHQEPAGPRRVYAKPTVAELRAKLNAIQFEVTQNDATEPPFRNEFWDNHEPGIYVDVATGEPLFSSLDKFDSGTGWPSFSRPIEKSRVTSKSDDKLGVTRTEVRSSGGDSHLGHVFDDGPAPTRLRYCINSASLRFVPLAKLAEQGYAAYAARFGGGASAAIPPSTANACAMPAPGERPGCEATLETAKLEGGAEAAASLRAVDGVLQVRRETSGVHVVFDPGRIAYVDLVAKWVAFGGSRSTR